ncbi:MAG: UDP-N-acetylglucosamine--N-acetylmuramyl-(pentapeptide) pyrophosphoryl-undecaprenol N-acetylglucosamine transferase [Firmicutes bacterium]|nr:UDP-N-acetylglucosamine--N-acetylmuramyl-(pentapeptide) pyrophosphoryl-undecaprenol N-acetylglucosamine transferase [Bacillota bacterium]
MQKLRVILAGGGTGGHIYPAIALAKEIQRRHDNAEILFVGAARGMERDLVPAAGFRLATLEITSLPRRLPLQQVQSGWRALRAVVAAAGLLRDFSPHVVVGTGGYAAGPLLLAAAILGFPTLIHEQNAFPSLTNRILSRFVRGIAVSHAVAREHFPAAKVRVTGNPLRPELFAVDRQRARKELGLNEEQKFLVVVGGSGGARALNQAVISAYPVLAQAGVVVYHVTGKRYYSATLGAAEGFSPLQIRVVDYAANMPDVLAAADLVVSRAGGITAELALLGKPSILIPLPTAPNDHQLHNARAVEHAGGAILVEERFLTGQSLAKTMGELFLDPTRLKAMSEKSKTLAFPNATRDLCDLMEQIMRWEN